jgi:hypothetical protein
VTKIETSYKVEGLEFKTLAAAQYHLRKIELLALIEEKFKSGSEVDLLDLVGHLVDNRYHVNRILQN